MTTIALPIPNTRFFGRASEIAEIIARLEHARLVTLTGAGGSGKTRLALETARSLGDAYGSGMHWIELTTAAGKMAVFEAVAAALDVREQPGQPMDQTLIDGLSGKDLLLLLDNCEHIRGVCSAFLDTLLDACPDLQVLATSREPLGNPIEVIVPVPPLSLPVSGDLATVSQSAAAGLFADRASARLPDFSLTADNSPAVARICHRLDGMPLAIELAAARTDVLTVQQIAGWLDDRFGLLTTGSMAAPERHQTLRAAIDWSHELLPLGEQILLRRMAVFAGGCSFDGVESVCAFGDLSPNRILDLVAALIAKSMLVSKTVGRSEASYRMLETIREYAQEQLAKAGEELTLRDRHLDYYLAQAEATAPKLHGQYQQLWLARLEGEHDNFRAALSWALESGHIIAGLRLVVALYDFWVPRGHLREAVMWTEAFLQHAPDDTPPLLLAQANLSLIGPSWLLRDTTGLETRATRAVALAESAGEEGKATLASALFGHASILGAAGNYARAYELIQRSLQLRRELDARPLIAFSLLGLSDMAAGLGRLDEARAALEEGLALSEEIGERFWNANILKALGTLERYEQRPGQAVAHLEQSAARFRALGAERETAIVLTALALALLDQGKLSQTRELLGESLALHRGVDNCEGIIACLAGFGELAATVDRPLDASRLLAAAEALAELHPVFHFPTERLLRERFKGTLQDRLPAQVWEKTQRQGRLMSTQDAMDLALSIPSAAPGAATKDLTRRELEVARLVGRGLTNSEVAGALVVSKRTVEKHIANIFSKLEFTDRSQLILWSIENGLVDT